MCLSKRKLAKIRECIRKKCKLMQEDMFWTYIKKITLSTSPKIYYYIGSTDDKTRREISYNHICKADIIKPSINVTSVERFIIQHKNIITLCETKFMSYFYDVDCVDKLSRQSVRLHKEQMLFQEYKMIEQNNSTIKFLNKRNPRVLIPYLRHNMWNKKPYICPCGFLKKNCDYTCSNGSKLQHSRQNYTHLQWLKNNPQEN